MSNYTYIDSPFVSKYYKWFCELGYPQLDIVESEDGEWWIIEMLNAPVVPCLTRTSTVLHGMRHMEPQFSFCKKYIDMLDMHKRHYLDYEEAKSQRIIAEREAVERKWDDNAQRKLEICKRNEALMERVMKQGIDAVRPENIFRNLSRNEKRGLGYVDRKFYTAG